VSSIQPLTRCPVCNALAAEGRPHCITTTCKWNVCKPCGYTYDRHTGTAFKQGAKDQPSQWKAGEAA